MAWGTVNVQSAGSKSAPNGAEWTQSNLTGVTVNSIHHHDGVWVLATAGNGLYYSTDGKTWTQTNVTSYNFYSIDTGNGYWAAGTSDSGTYYSTDGKTWTKSSLSTSGDFRWVKFIRGWWFYSSPSSSLYVASNGYPTSGADYVSFSYSGTLTACYRTRYNRITWATSSGYKYYRTFESTASSVAAATSNSTNSGKTFYDVALIAGNYEVECWGSYIQRGAGSSWTKVEIPAQSVHYGNGIVMVAGPSIKPHYSSDGLTYTECSSAPSGILKTAYGNGVWVGTGTAGTFIANGNLEWSQTSTISSKSAHYADGVWVLVANDGTLYYSEAFTAPKE